MQISELSKFINELMKYSTKYDIDNMKNNCNFTERQEKIFSMYYIDDKDRNYIADHLGYSAALISKELFVIRMKIEKITG